MNIFERIERIAAIGDRPGYSAAEDAAHDLAAGWMAEAGLEVTRDEAGNLLGRRGEARIWTGSHTTVPHCCKASMRTSGASSRKSLPMLDIALLKP